MSTPDDEDLDLPRAADEPPPAAAAQPDAAAPAAQPAAPAAAGRSARFWAGLGAGAIAVVVAVLVLLDWQRAREAVSAFRTDASEQRQSAREQGELPDGLRRVLVRVLDVTGEPVSGARVLVSFAARQPILGEEIEPGKHQLDGLPDEFVEIVAEISGRRYHMTHQASKSSATLVIPTGGRVQVDWSLPSKLDLHEGRVMLTFEPRGASADRFEVSVPSSPDNRGTLNVGYVLPGSYLAQLEYWKESPEFGGTAKVRSLTAPLPVVVQERELTKIGLGLQ